jgi:DNA-binding response OmpR family regulator
MPMDDSAASIFVVEDDHAYARETAEYLARYGYRSTILDSIPALLAALSGPAPLLVILDQFIGNEDAVRQLPQVRDRYAGGIVVLTGNADVTDRVVALETGADDFVHKATPPRELVARLRAVMRRSPAPAEPAALPAVRRPGRLQVDGWMLDFVSHEVINDAGAAARLTLQEFNLLYMLVADVGAMLDRARLSEQIFKRP